MRSGPTGVVPLFQQNDLCPDRATLANWLHQLADEIGHGETDAARLFVVIEGSDGRLSHRCGGAVGLTNAHLCGALHTAAALSMQA